MTTTLKSAVNRVTDFVFPISSDDVERQRLTLKKSGYEYVSNLPLQMALYFNCFYFPFWLIGSSLALSYEFSYMNSIYQVVNIAVLVLYSIVEIVRLYIGYLGNLTEKVPELAGCWLLTFLIQLPAICFLLFNNEMILSPLERTFHAVEFVFVVLEFVIGYFAIKIMISHQAVKFHMKMEFQNLDDIAEEGDIGVVRNGEIHMNKYHRM